jgi:hypothetical protein
MWVREEGGKRGVMCWWGLGVGREYTWMDGMR